MMNNPEPSLEDGRETARDVERPTPVQPSPPGTMLDGHTIETINGQPIVTMEFDSAQPGRGYDILQYLSATPLRAAMATPETNPVDRSCQPECYLQPKRHYSYPGLLASECDAHPLWFDSMDGLWVQAAPL